MYIEEQQREVDEMMGSTEKLQFVLVHGMCHGGWCWYKLAALLAAAGHRVAAPDMAGSGVRPEGPGELRRFADYWRPLAEVVAAVPPGEKAVLVGHSYGGPCVAAAAESFPEKVAVAIFVSAFMPSTATPFTRIGEKFSRRHPPDHFLDTEFVIGQDARRPTTSIKFGTNFMATKLYQLSPPEDLTLAKMLVRPGRCFPDDPESEIMVTERNYGLIKRAFVVCKEDKAIEEEFQRWMIEQSQGVEVKEIEGADHMVMLSKPEELCNALLEIAEKYQ